MEPLRGLHKEIPSAGAIATRFHLVGELMVVWERNVDHQAMHHDNAFNGNNDNNSFAARRLKRTGIRECNMLMSLLPHSH
jgi:hypothetical protein